MKLFFVIFLFSTIIFGPEIQKNISSAQEVTSQETDKKKLKQDFIKAGRLYYDSKKYDAAIQQWEEALLLDPENKKIKRYIKNAQDKLERQRKKENKDIQLISITAPPEESLNVLTLDECLSIAMKNSIPLQIAKKNMKLAEMRIWESRRNLFPKINILWEEYSGKVQGRYYYGKKEYIDGQHTLPLGQGAETYYVMKQAEINVKVAREEYQKTKNELVLQVKKGFYSLAKAKENLNMQLDLKKEVDRIYDMVRKQFDAGVTSKLEFLNVTSQTDQVRYQLASAEGDKSIAELILKQALNIDYQEKIDVAPKLDFKKIDVEFEKVLRAAFMNRPEVRINSLTVEYNKYEKDITKAKGWPKIDIMGNWGLAKEEYTPEDNRPKQDGTTDPDRKLEQEWYGGAKVSMPFWGSTGEFSLTREQWQPVVSAYQGTEAFTKTAKINILDKLNYFSDKLSADIELDRARQEMMKIKQDVTAEARESCFNYEKSLIQLETASSKVKYQETDLELSKVKRSMDEALDSNVIESMIRLAQEKFGYVQAQADCYVTIASINKAIGVDDYFKIEGESTDINKK